MGAEKSNIKQRKLIYGTAHAAFWQERFIGPDLGPNCLQKLSADDKSNLSLRTDMGAEKRYSSSEGF